MTDQQPNQPLVRIEDEPALGPAMQALSPIRRAFVAALVQTGCTATQAAEAAGYSNSSQPVLATMGWKLAHDARVQAAILEECQKLIRADGPMALTVLRFIAKDTCAAPRDRIKAATELLNRGGFHAVTQHNVTVTHQSEADKDREILALAAELGLDDAAKAKLLGKPLAIDAEYVEIADPPTERSAEEREARHARDHETPEEREDRHARTREERIARGKAEYEVAQERERIRKGWEGLEDVLGLNPDLKPDLQPDLQPKE